MNCKIPTKQKAIKAPSLTSFLLWGFYGIIHCAFLFAIIACNNQTMDEVITLMSHPIKIPSGKMDKRICSHLRNSTKKNNLLRVVYYIDSLNCQTCRMMQLAKYEEIKDNNIEMADVDFIIIINSTAYDKEFLYSRLCNARIRSTIYLDTINAFRQANPHIPDNSALHTFVINEKDSVVLVGNPFQNDRMEALFEKVIENEKRKQ